MSKRQVVGSMSKWSGALKDFFRLGDGSIALPMVKDFVERRNPFVNNAFLRRISDEPLIVDAVGQKVIADANDVFAYIDPDLKIGGADEPLGEATTATKAVVYEMIRNGSFAELFGLINSDPRKLCFSQEQIINFCVEHRGWLRTDGYATLFLFESQGQFFVACVRVHFGGGLGVCVFRFGRSPVCYAELRRRVVVPQLA